MSDIDQLTGLELPEALAAHLEQLGRDGIPAVVMMLDLDKFKDINELYSHPVGSNVLHVTGALLHRLVTNRYVHARAFRYGGEEFCVVLRGHNIDEAAALAERIRQEIADCQFADVPRRVTVTIGIAGPDSTNLDATLKKADTALGEGKRAGRNRVVRYSDAFDPRDTRRVVISPWTMTAVGKTFRLAFVRTGSYYHAATLIHDQYSDTPIKLVSVLGAHDLLITHLGVSADDFKRDVHTFLEESGVEPETVKLLPHYTVKKILKISRYHRRGSTDGRGAVRGRASSAARRRTERR